MLLKRIHGTDYQVDLLPVGAYLDSIKSILNKFFMPFFIERSFLTYY